MRRVAPKPIAKILSENVLALRAARGLTQEQLADAADVPRSTISNIEGERYAMPRADVLGKVALALDVTPGELMTDGFGAARAKPPAKSRPASSARRPA